MIIDTTENKFCRELDRKRQLVNLIHCIHKRYPKKLPYIGVNPMYGIVTSLTVNRWQKDTGLKFDYHSLNGTDGEIILQMAEAELNSGCQEISSHLKFCIANIDEMMRE